MRSERPPAARTAASAGEPLTLTPAEFAANHGWKNDPAQVPLDTIIGPAPAGDVK